MAAEQVDLDFIHRELAVELGLSPAMLKNISDRLFRKILKHLMRGRDVKVKDFGIFFLQFRRPKPVPLHVQQKVSQSSPKFVPMFRFKSKTSALIQESQHEAAQIHHANTQGKS